MKKFFLIPLMTLVCSVMAFAGVAKIGNTQYETLNDAFAAAKNGDAIEMLADAVVSSSITIDNKKVTLHMLGHAITNNVGGDFLFKVSGASGNFVVVGNADGISANASMVIPSENTTSKGFVLYSGNASNIAFTAYNVNFTGKLNDSWYFNMANASSTTENRSLLLQDCNANVPLGNNKGIIGHNDDQRSYSVRILRGEYVFYSTKSSLQVFRCPQGSSTVDLQGVHVVANRGPICEAADGTVVTYTDCNIEWDGLGGNDWRETAVSSQGYAEANGTTYTPGRTGYFGEGQTCGVSIVNSGTYSAVNALETYSSGGAIVVNGGTFSGTTNVLLVGAGTRYSTTAWYSTSAEINITGGTFDGNFELYCETKAASLGVTSTVKISGGTFTNLNNITFRATSGYDATKCHLIITGGTFSGSAINAASLANYVDTEHGYIITDNGNGSFTVTQQQSTEDKAAITWQDSNDWSADEVPGATTEVSVAANQTVTVGDNVSTEVVAEAKSIALAPNSELVIKSGSTLIVGEGGITGTGSGASDAKIIVEEGGQLLIDPAAEQHPYGTVKYKSVAKVDGDYEGGHVWEQIGVPTMGNPSVEATEHADMYFNVWDPTNGWVALDDYSQFNTPFKGYNFTNASNVGNVVYTFKGQLVGNQQQALDFPRDGYSFFANSYTGPIDIVTLLRQFETGSDVQRGVYLYDPLQEKYLSINEANAGTTVLGIYYPAEIKPMQAFYLYSHATTSGSASYEDLVWTPARAAMSNPAPRRRALSANIGLAIKLTAENGRCDNVILAETANSDLNTYKMMNPSKSVNIYAVTENGKMANFAAEDINNTFIGFTTNGSASYTLSFDAVNGEYALRDMYTGNTVRIENGVEYAFEAMPNGTMENRFQIVKAPKVTTGVDEVLNEVLCTKVIENGVLYIIKDGVKYNAQGVLVK